MRKRLDRVRMSGGEKLYSPNGTLPRNTNRDFEHGLLYRPARAAVYLDGVSTGRKPHSYFTPTVSSFRPFPAKHAVRHSKAMSLQSPLWRVELKRMPSRVLFCVRRKQRREVLFALNRAGYSGSARKAHFRRTVSSNYGC